MSGHENEVRSAGGQLDSHLAKQGSSSRDQVSRGPSEKQPEKIEASGDELKMTLPIHAQKDAYSAEAAAKSSVQMTKVHVKAGEYVGQSLGGKRHGKGSYSWACGQKYEGGWREDMRNGIGTETWADGRKYHGEWRDDAFDGTGTFTWTDGTIYKGTFKRYAPVEGEMFLPSGEVYAVTFDGTDEVWSGTKPSPIVRTPLLDEELVQDKVDKMYEALCTGTLYGDMLREKVLKGKPDANELEIDDIFFEDVEGSDDEVEVTFDVRRLSAEMVRPTLDANKDVKAFGKEKGGFRQGAGMGRVSMDNQQSRDARRIYENQARLAAEGRTLVTAEEITEEIKPMRLKEQYLDPEGYAKRVASSEAERVRRTASSEVPKRSRERQRSSEGRRSGGSQDGRRSAAGPRSSNELRRRSSGGAGERRSIDMNSVLDSDERIRQLADMIRAEQEDAVAAATTTRKSDDGAGRGFRRTASASMDAKIDLSKGQVKIKVKRDQIAALQELKKS